MEWEGIAGRWKVKGVPVVGKTQADDGEMTAGRDLHGLMMILDSQGCVMWEVPPGAPGLPLFETTAAFLYKTSLTFLSGVQDWSVTFTVKGEPEKGWMVLESDEDGVNLVLTFSKEEATDPELANSNFSLKKALEEPPFFSDILFTCCDGRELHAHQAVLAAVSSHMKEANWRAVFQAKPHDFGRQLLSCIYTDSLPSDLDLTRAQQMLEWLSEHPLLERLTQMVSVFIGTRNLKQRLMTMIDDLFDLLLHAKTTVTGVNVAEPIVLKYTIKQLIKDAVLGGAKACFFCHTYSTRRREMGKEDWEEVLKYLQSRVVVFLDLLREVGEEAVQKWESLSRDQQLEIARELIPDIEEAWDKFLRYENLCQSLGDSPPAKSEPAVQGATVAMALHLLSHGAERKRLRKIRKELLESMELAQSKRVWWNACSESEKAQQVLDVIGKIVNEVEGLKESIEARKKHLLLGTGLQWKTFRSSLDVVCMYMSWGLQKVLTLKSSLSELLRDVLHFVGRSEVNETAVYLGLLEKEELLAMSEEAIRGDATGNPTRTLPNKLSGNDSGWQHKVGTGLAQGCARLVSSQRFADMEFVLELEEMGKTMVIPAHRVIVAARCEWASRALHSKMKEDLERRITVSGVDESVFHLFLSYLYGAPLIPATMDTETLVELMTVADRYETQSLMQSCEVQLVARIQSHTVLQLLAVADALNAHRLKQSSLCYILKQPQVIVDGEGFGSLSDSLQQEIRGLLSGTQDPILALRHSQLPTHAGLSSSSSSRASSEDEEELKLDPGPREWDLALDSLRAVLGSEIADQELRQLLLMADMDINRAVNYFFSNT